MLVRPGPLHSHPNFNMSLLFKDFLLFGDGTSQQSVLPSGRLVCVRSQQRQKDGGKKNTFIPRLTQFPVAG